MTKATANYGFPYPEPGDHTRTWEYWQALAEAIDAKLAGGFVVPNGDVVVGKPTVATQRGIGADRLVGAAQMGTRLGIDASSRVELLLKDAGVNVGALYLTRTGQLSVWDGVNTRALPFATYAAVPSVPAGTGLNLTFPTGRFTQPPVVVTGLTQDPNWTSSAINTTATATTIRHSIGSGPWGINVIAIQALPTGTGLELMAAVAGRYATCHTADCDNGGIGIAVPDDDTPVMCGVCLNPITDVAA